ncbi:unnamed protein product [Rotaria socialis]|uniref:Uncharacterized protein n=1 Tax=Rotaria socialis TaxID=392032 RepID=A0A818XS70_9BILA|nr:unnamed protein product [Rotaria socialis]CAF3416919.1 unnamed protein product [Rotaria socialis]CAF3744902.1 unnamed protein product [Rotaria socialis]CAF4176753.1 unnamed protein product [Rotaria socialis]CAF4404525.1 unnamed protein product [Rotaria socialis]
MLPSSNSRLKYRQIPSIIGNHEVLDELAMKPTSSRTSSQSPRTSNDKWNDDYRKLQRLTADQSLIPSQIRTSSQSPTTRHEKGNDDHRVLRKSIVDQQLNASQSRSRSRSRSSSINSLRSIVIEGQWKYQRHDDDRLRLKSIGIENLVAICYEIMNVTLETTHRKQKKTKKLSSTNFPWPIVELDEYKTLSNNDKISLRRAGLLNLVTIVYEAAWTSASISQLVRIWREASRSSKSTKTKIQPLMSYEHAFEHLIHQPDDKLLEIALHASLISSHSLSDLKRLGEQLGIRTHQFDMGSIQDSTKQFQNLIKFLREQKLEERRKQQFIDKNILPYEPKRKQGLYANVLGTKFDLIRQAVHTSGFFESPAPDFTCNLLWNDSLISIDIVSALKPYQKVNHFPTTIEISHKDLLQANYDKLSNVVPREYNFAPKTWILSKEYNLWYSYASSQPKNNPSVFIVKPSHANMEEGISIYCDYKQIEPMDNYIIQEYIREPYLIEGFKFDLQIYVLITSCDPLRVFLYNDGLVRMSPKKYKIPNSKNAADLSMHLTHYLINKNDTDNSFNTDIGKSHRLKYLFQYLRNQNQDVNKLQKEIQDIVIKTIFLAEPNILTTYRTCRPGALSTSESVCFELLSFDILIDKKLKPWIIEVNRCPSFDANRQIEFDIKIKLLFDTLDLLHFRVSDRKKSIAIEKLEAQRRLYANIGKYINNQTDELSKMKEILHLLRQEKQREDFESRHSNDFIRLFPVNDQHRMNELMNILAKCFQVLCKHRDDLSWTTKYYNQYNEEELLYKIVQLQNIYQRDLQDRSKLTHTSNESVELNHLSSSTSFIFEENENEKQFKLDSSYSDRIQRYPSSTSDTLMKIVSTQTPSDIVRSSSLSSLNKKKQQSNSLISTGNISRSRAESDEIPPGVSANRITEKEAYSTLPAPSKYADQQRLHSSKTKNSNDKSQIVTYSSIVRAMRQQQQQQQSSSNNQSAVIDMKKKLQLNDDDINRLYQLILDQMNKLCIHYPNKSYKETNHIFIEIMKNWNEYKSDIGRFWLAEFDANKRQSIIDIVWNNVQQIIKKLCIFDELAQQLSLNRHLMKLQRRLLANHGQCLWDTCQNKHNSWESLFVKSTNHLSEIELDCCYRFVDLCKETLFIVYRYSTDEKIYEQKVFGQS